MRPLACLCAVALLASVATAASLERGSPGSRLPNSSDASEYWDFIARLDSGHVVLTRFSITNDVPGDHVAYMIAHVVFPDGRSVQFEKGRKKGRWSLSEDGLHIVIGENELHQSDPERSLKIERGPALIDLHFTPDASRGLARDPIGMSYWVDLLHTSAPVTGSLFVPGMDAPIDVRGSISGTHTWMHKSESKLNRRRIEFFSMPGGEKATEDSRTEIYIADFTSPKGARSAWLVVERDGELIYQGDQFEVELQGKLDSKLGKRYPVPAKLLIKGPDVEGEIQLSRLLTTDRPMNIIPQPFRFLLSFKMSPRRAWVDSTFSFRLLSRSDEPKVEVSGTGVAAVMYVNPLPRGR